ncbi:MAG: YggT family protein [bacterium]|jgi:YggT family protein|nr:YggT family protein [bacterium]MBK7045554.1 YggT family protein [bacterium]MBK7187515.1 YggT family protein [bacterium]MBK7671968.1 YggT family protein [bacterium]MBK7769326.1 YggT family protein [bacterium]
MDIVRLGLALLQVYTWLILGRVILSWVNPQPRNELLLWVIRLTEPVLGPLRRLIPIPGIDLSPLVAWLLIQLLMRLIAQAGA